VPCDPTNVCPCTAEPLTIGSPVFTGALTAAVKVIWVLVEPPPGSVTFTVTISAVESVKVKVALPLASEVGLALEGEAAPVAAKLTTTPETGLPPLVSFVVTVTETPVWTELEGLTELTASVFEGGGGGVVN
jgi:hypothetical protein